MFCQIISYLPGSDVSMSCVRYGPQELNGLQRIPDHSLLTSFGCHPLYLAVGVMDLEGDGLPVQLDPLGVDQLGAVLVLPNEPST